MTPTEVTNTILETNATLRHKVFSNPEALKALEELAKNGVQTARPSTILYARSLISSLISDWYALKYYEGELQ